MISPVTVRKALEAYEAAKGLDPLDLGALGPFMASVKTFCKGYKTITKTLFKADVPQPVDYTACGRAFFGSSFFEALAAFCKAEEGGEHSIHQILGLPLTDSKAMSEALRQ